MAQLATCARAVSAAASPPRVGGKKGRERFGPRAVGTPLLPRRRMRGDSPSSLLQTAAFASSRSGSGSGSGSRSLPPKTRVEGGAQDVRSLLGSLLGSLQMGKGGDAKRTEAKRRLLDAIQGTARGVKATDADKDGIDAAASDLERLNPNPSALTCEELNGEWELLYTTSASILGANRPWPFRPLGPIYQTIDAPRRRAANRETFPFFNAVAADLTPTSAAAVDVQFVEFKIFGLVTVKAPPSARGALAVTYLDDELRVSRGDKGNLFVLRMADPTRRLPRPGDEVDE